MDTKWKKWKAAISFLIFFSGMTLFISNLVVAAGLIVRSNGDVLHGETDYQTKEEFRWYISERLEELLGVAAGGKGFCDTGIGVAEAEQIIIMEGSNDTDWYEPEYGGWENWYQPAPEEYMADMARDKNLLYAVVYQGKLLYTNMDSFVDKEGESWEENDFYEFLSPDEYNFSLWFNRNGDGKVQITKDGREEDVYGDGIYRESSRWFVPGYHNFEADTSAYGTVIFLAAAKEPSLYVAGNYSEYGSV